MSGKLFAFNVSKPIAAQSEAVWQGANKALAAYCSQGGNYDECYADPWGCWLRYYHPYAWYQWACDG